MAARKPTSLDDMTPDEIRALVHELEIHKVELEIQNGQLTETHLTLDEARDLEVAEARRSHGFDDVAGEDRVGVAIERDETTAFLVRGEEARAAIGDRFEVTGKWKVAIHDNTRLYQPWEKPYYVLSAGDDYNMRARRLEKLGTGSPPPPPRGRGGNDEQSVAPGGRNRSSAATYAPGDHVR